MMYAIPQDSSPINISNTTSQVVIYNILVWWILCRMYLYMPINLGFDVKE